MDNTEKTKLLINFIQLKFDQLRGDWSDNRHWCREGWEAVNRLQILLGFTDKIGQRNYPHLSDEQYYEIIKGDLTNGLFG